MSDIHPALPSLLLLFSRHSHLQALEANFFLPSGDQDVLGDKRKDSVHSHQKLLSWFTLFTVIVSKLPSGRALIFFFFLSQFLSNTQHSPSPTISANLGRSCALEFSGAIYHLQGISPPCTRTWKKSSSKSWAEDPLNPSFKNWQMLNSLFVL